MAEDSLGKRYAFKLVSNVATIPLFFVMEAVLPRALGPAAYGNYSFSTTVFLNFTNFLDMGTSTCLSTSLAKRQDEYGLLAFYMRVGLLMGALCLLAGAAMYVPGAGGLILPGVPLWMAVPAAFWAYLTWAGRVTRGVNDALGITARSELVRIGVNLASALALLALFFAGLLSLRVLFLHQYLSLGIMAAGFALIMRTSWKERASALGGSGWSLPPGAFTAYAREFARYSSPLFITALASTLVLSGERWLLQFFEGSVQQGYFSLSVKIGAACFLFVSALTPLLMREMAVAHGRNDPQAIARLLDRYAPMLYSLAAWLACFTLVEAPAVVRLFGGAEFTEAMLPVQIMALYPVHQGYGQLANSVFYATGETRLLRNISLWLMLLGLAMAWVLLAPQSMFGLQLGATGLALKMVLAQFIAVNVLFYFCRRAAPFNFLRNFMHQIACPLALCAVALCARYGTEFLGLGGAKDFPRFFSSGLAYTALCLTLALALPSVFGLRRGELREFFRRGMAMLRPGRR